MASYIREYGMLLSVMLEAISQADLAGLTIGDEGSQVLLSV